MASKPTTRKERRKHTRKLYLSGKSRGTYQLSKHLQDAIEEAGSSSTAESDSGSLNKDVCVRCAPALRHYKNVFFSFMRHGTDLKKAKSTNPYPKNPDRSHYRNVKAQNEWLRNNIFDPMGNYLFCAKCLKCAFRISPQRLARQRLIKRKQSMDPLQELTKPDVQRQKLEGYVVMPDGVDICFTQWWKNLQSEATVNVRTPHERHGLAGQTSNSAKRDTCEDFLIFVDTNSQPNRRSEGSYGHIYTLLPAPIHYTTCS